MGKHSHSIGTLVINRITKNGRGWVFTPDHFCDLGSRNAVASALKRYKQSGQIRQLAFGLYDFPRTDKQLGELLPSIDAIVNALAGRDAIRLQPSGAYAANLLGLSTQVPVKVVYLTDGRSRTVRVGKQQIILKETTPRNMATAGRMSGVVIQALRYLGKDQVDDDVVRQLGNRLDDHARKQLMKDIRYAPAWIADIFRKISKGIEEPP